MVNTASPKSRLHPGKRYPSVGGHSCLLVLTYCDFTIQFIWQALPNASISCKRALTALIVPNKSGFNNCTNLLDFKIRPFVNCMHSYALTLLYRNINRLRFYFTDPDSTIFNIAIIFLDFQRA